MPGRSRPILALTVAVMAAGCTGSQGRLDGFTNPDVSVNRSPEAADPTLARFEGGEADVTTLFDNRNLSQAATAPAPAASRRHQVSLNNVPIAQAAKLILHDRLGLPVQIDTSIEGNISIEARKGISEEHLLRLFGTALRDSGANLTIAGGTAIIKDGPVFPMPRHENGAGITIVQLDYITANDFVGLVADMLGTALKVRSDPASNSLIISGPSISVEGLVDLARQMDKPQWRFASYSLVPVDEDSARLTEELVGRVFAGTNAPSVSVRYIERLSALWVIGVSDLAVERAKQVVAQFERFAFQSRPQRIVWPMKSANARNVASLLLPLTASDGNGTTDSPLAAARSAGAEAASGRTSPSAGSGTDVGGSSGASPARSTSSTSAGSANAPLFNSVSALGAGADGTRSKTIIMADEATNSLILEITPKKWERILPLLLDLDRPVTQVYISVNILEIALTHSLSFGLQHALSHGDFSWVLSMSESSAITPTFPGLSISFDSGKIDLFLDNLAKATDLTVISTPNLMVQHGETGEIKVGDQIPTLLSTISSKDSDYSTTQIDYRNTGLSLDVTPFVDGRDQVRLAVSASVDSAGKNETSSIDSPVISRRSIKTTVTSRHNQTIILGGLRRRTREASNSGLPFLGRLAFLNGLLGATSKSTTETELVILLTPKVISGMADLSELSTREIAEVARYFEQLGAVR